jgi:hypothetical protein
MLFGRNGKNARSAHSIWKLGRALASGLLAVLGALTLLIPNTALAANNVYTDNQNGTVTDPLTQLTWMRCAMGQVWDGQTCSGTATRFDVATSTALTGKTSFAGRTDWRLPSIRELWTIFDISRVSPSLDVVAFPNTPSVNFLTSTAYAPSPAFRWIVYFGDTTPSYDGVRLVRGGLSSSLMNLERPATDYVDNGDGTATHKPTNLIWQRCAVGYTWTGSSCTGTPNNLTFEQAAALTSSFAGKTDWRLPTIDELESLVDYTKANNVLNSTAFPPATGTDRFWSSSQYPLNAGFQWSFLVSTGGLSFSATNTLMQVLLVRTDTTSTLRPDLLTLSGSSTLQSGARTTLTAAARYTDNSQRTVNPVWTSSDPVAAAVSSNGVVSAGVVSVNTPVTISASWTENGATVESSLVITITAAPATPKLLTLTGSDTLQSGASTTLTATARYTDNSQRTVSPVWISSNPVVAVVSTAGVVTANVVSVNTPVTISASWTERGATVQSTLVITITAAPATPNLLTLTGSNTLQKGASTTLTATARYTDNSQRTVSPVWTSSNPVAAVVSTAGVVTAGVVSVNTPVTISASWTERGVTVQSTLVITITAGPPTPKLLTLTGSDTLQSGTSTTLTATAGYTDNSQRAVSPVWTSSNPVVAAVSVNGVVTAGVVSVNTPVTISASWTESGATVQSSVVITITAAPPAPNLLTVTGSNTLQSGARTTLTATARYADSSERAVHPVWTSSDPVAAIVSTAGAVTAGVVSVDTPVTISASWTESGTTVQSSLVITVTARPAVLAGLNLTGVTKLQSSGQVRLVLNAVYSDSSSKAVSATSFALSNPALGSVDSRGVLSVTRVTVDTTLTVTATYEEGGIVKSASLPVTITAAPAVLSQLTIVGATALLASGQSLNLSALGVYDDSTSKTVAANWQVAGTAATVSSAGVFQAMTVSTDTPVVVSASYTEAGVTVSAQFQVIIQATAQESPIQAEVQTTGTIDNFSLEVWTSASSITPGAASNTNASRSGTAHPATTGRPVYKLFVVAVIPGGKVLPVDSIFTLNRSSEWQGLSFPVAEYLNGVAENSLQLVEILDKIDVSIISGSKIFVGYGTDDQEMLASGRFRMVYQIQ